MQRPPDHPLDRALPHFGASPVNCIQSVGQWTRALLRLPNKKRRLFFQRILL
jgi:hypothetical protein